MNQSIFKDSLVRFKQELPTIILLIALQTLMNFTFPWIFVKASHSLDVLIKVLMSIACACVYTYTIVFPETIRLQINLNFFDHYPNPVFVKRLYKLLMFIMFSLSFVYLWWVNYYHIPAFWYTILYLYSITMIALFYSAVQKRTMAP
ncbi:MAG: hypothetical protein UU47_C0001G0091 [candidate division TM6 bacterium GW2011_GWE2_41_16]|nr:MAG: hypothetical protein UU47_C0001G0091 [candidate division TM6 bacterium GW2011_GWE2_41_16]